MKKTVCVLMSLLLCLMLSVASATDTFSDPVDEEEAFLEEETLTEEPTQGDESAAGTPAIGVTEPTVRWAYGVSLTALQSPYLILVNEENPLDKGYVPEPLVKMNMVKRATSNMINLQDAAAKAVEEMFEEALAVRSFTHTKLNSRGNEVEETLEYPDGMVLYLKSGYRSYSQQSTTYSNYLARNNNVDDGYVAKPGASEHQSGLSCDILNKDYAGRSYMTQDFKDTPEAKWMKEHCAEFGLILRYTEAKEATTGIKFEPWHFRYVGKEAAGYISATGMSLEEFTVEWQKEIEDFLARGGDIQEQLAYEENTINAPPASYILNEMGEDGDAEISLVF